jgi:hypothetical protein
MGARDQELARHRAKVLYIQVMEESGIYPPECTRKMLRDEEETHSRIMGDIDRVERQQPNSLGS